MTRSPQTEGHDEPETVVLGAPHREHQRMITEPCAPLLQSDDDTGPIRVALRLVCVAGPDLGCMFPLSNDPIVIGRGSAVGVNLRASDVSRDHARLSPDGDHFVLEDSGSANGTFVNGTRVERRTRLAVGDRVQLGSTILVFTRHDELEERLRQLQKLEAMAELVGGLSHDFNNVLQVILSGLEEVDELLPPEAGTLRETVADSRRAAMVGAGLAKRLVNLGRSGPGVFHPVELGPLVDETVAMARHLIDDRISITTKVDPDTRIQGAREEIHQVLLNLLLNARDAMPDGGEVTISARTARLDRATALALHLASEGTYIELVVTDTGTGMDEATLARAFEPFFTTKSPGKGTGLGLTMIHGIVRRHGGTVIVESAQDRGTTFRIWLPSPESAVEQPRA